MYEKKTHSILISLRTEHDITWSLSLNHFECAMG